MMTLFEREKIRHPLIDFSQEALKLIVNLRNNLMDNKVRIDDIEKLVFDNILDRRLLLTQKFILLDKYYDLFFQCKINKEENETNVKELEINNVIMKVNHFLWCLKFTANFDGESITKDKLIVTKKYLDQNFFEELEDRDKNDCNGESKMNTAEEIGLIQCSNCQDCLLSKENNESNI